MEAASVKAATDVAAATINPTGWDRIFSEKYADSTYYPLKVSHNSTLAGA